MESALLRGSVAAAIATILVLDLNHGTQLLAQEDPIANPALVARGDWDSAKTYGKDAIVTAHGSAWISLKANNKGKVPGQTDPSTTAWWDLFARGINPVGGWSGARKYQPDDVVTFQGQTYRAKLTN